MTTADAVYERGFARWKASLEPSHLIKVFETTGRFVTRMGDGGVLETGLTLQHTYGTPMIPGATIKGVCSHYFVTEVESRIEKNRATVNVFSICESPGARILSHPQVVEDDSRPER